MIVGIRNVRKALQWMAGLAGAAMIWTGVANAQTSLTSTPPYEGPIIDTHLHAFPANFRGPPPTGVCVGEARELSYRSERPWSAEFLELVKKPRCANPIWSSRTDIELRDQTLAALRRLNVTGIVSGPVDRVRDYAARLPGRVIPAIEFNLKQFHYTPADVARLLDTGGFKVLGEVTDQYDGVAPDDPRLDAFWKVAADRDVPVAIHLGVGPPGAPYLTPEFRAHLHSPFALERILTRHPNLRVYAMHAAWPMLDELKAMLYTYPQLYVDTGSLQFALTRAEYYSFLKNLVAAGFADRIMFGSDQQVWPGLIEEGIHAINEAPITTEQKRMILHDNAARFFRLDTPKSR